MKTTDFNAANQIQDLQYFGERFDIAKILPLYEAIYEKAIQEQFKTESN